MAPWKLNLLDFNIIIILFWLPRYIGARYLTEAWGPIYYGLTLIPALISNYIHYKVWNEITYPFLNFNGCTVEV